MKARYVVISISILLISYVGYNAYLYSWAERYNKKQWELYTNAFREVQDTTKPLIICRNSLQLQRDSLLPLYENALIKNSNGEGLSLEEKFYSAFYRKTNGILESLNNKISYYENDLPDIQAGMFFITEYKGKKQKLNLRIIRDREPETIEALNWYKYQFEREKDIMNKIKCTDFSSFDFGYPLSTKTCNALLNLEYSFATPPTKEENELEVEYKIRMKRFEEEYKNAENACTDGRLYTNSWSY